MECFSYAEETAAVIWRGEMAVLVPRHLKAGTVERLIAERLLMERETGTFDIIGIARMTEKYLQYPE